MVAVVLVAALILCRFSPAPAPPPPLPASNAYPALVQASHAIVIPSDDFQKMNEQQLQAVVASNSAALQLVRSNLNEKIQVPLEYSVAFSSKHLADLARFKQIARAFLAEARLAQMEQRPADAANSCLDTIRLGVECPRGGFRIDALVGVAIESMGASELANLADSLDQKTCKEAAKILEDIEGQQQTWDQILRQEHYWQSRTFPGARSALVRLFTFRSTRASEAKGEQRFKAEQTKIRKLMIELAARAYELENGHKPVSINDLIPVYLREVPQNPSTGKDFTYPP